MSDLIDDDVISSLRDSIINNHVIIAKAAKKGMIECKKDKCPNYKRRENDGHEWREVGCGVEGDDKPLIEHKICPYTHVNPFRYNPFKVEKNPELKGERVEIIYKCMEEVFIDTLPFGREIKKTIDKVYEDWNYE